jgi:hypothetical protein
MFRNVSLRESLRPSSCRLPAHTYILPELIGVLMVMRIHLDSSIETLTDAARELRNRCQYFALQGAATIKIGVIERPDGSTAHLVVLAGPVVPHDQGWSIGLAVAESFRALKAVDPGWHFYPIEDLDGADVDQDGNVTLADDKQTRLFDVRLITSPRACDLTDAERIAVRAIVASETGEPHPHFARLPYLSNVPLKVLRERIGQYTKRDSTIPELSWEVYRSALAKTGMRHPRNRR